MRLAISIKKYYLFITVALLSFLIPCTKAHAQAISAGTLSGNISACAGSASASPQLQQFTVTGNNLTGNITATAPSDFELSVSAASGFSGNIILTRTGGTVNSTTIYVRAASSARIGNISGNVLLNSTGAATQTVAVMGVVNVLPTVNNIADQTVANGATTAAINFSGAGNTTFNWTNNTPGIGLPATGTGNIASFTATNSGNAPVTATITVTPVSQGYAYITNSGSGVISVINVATNTVVTNITPPNDPFSICISPDGSKAYVGCGGGSASVAVINTTTNSLISTIPVSASGEATGITISPDGTLLYVENYVLNTISVVKALTGAVIAVIPVTAYPYGIAISPDGSNVYVAFTYNSFLSVISTATNTVTGKILLTSGASDMALSPDGSKLYVPAGNNVEIFDPATNAVITTIPTGINTGTIALSPDGTKAYVGAGSNEVLAINTVMIK